MAEVLDQYITPTALPQPDRAGVAAGHQQGFFDPAESASFLPVAACPTAQNFFADTPVQGGGNNDGAPVGHWNMGKPGLRVAVEVISKAEYFPDAGKRLLSLKTVPGRRQRLRADALLRRNIATAPGRVFHHIARDIRQLHGYAEGDGMLLPRYCSSIRSSATRAKT